MAEIKGVFFDQDRVVVFYKDVSHGVDLCRMAAAAAGGDGVAGAGAALAIVKAHEETAFDVSVGAVQVGAVIAASLKNAVVDLQDGSGPLATGNRNAMQVPSPGVLAACTEPPMASTKPLTMASPNPLLLPESPAGGRDRARSPL